MQTRDLHSELVDALKRRGKTRENGDVLEFQCVRHDDKNPSAWLGTHRWGCFTCGIEEPLDTLADEIGIEPIRRDFTVEDYAQLKGFDTQKLAEWGVTTGVDPNYPDRGKVVVIPCRDTAGRLVRNKFRSWTGTWWEGRNQPVYPYGLDTMARYPKHPVVLVEGESDCHAAWHHDTLAIGVPGAKQWKPTWAKFFTDRDVYVWREPDEAGDNFVKGITRDIPNALVIQANGTKDLADLHKSGDFEAALERLMSDAVTVDRGPQTTVTTVEPITLSHFLEQEGDLETEADFIIDGLVARDSLGGITGKPKVGKTTLKISQGLAIARGIEFCGRATQRSRVLWLNLEQPRRLLAFKLKEMCVDLGYSDFLVVPWATRNDVNPTILERWIRDLEISMVVIDSLHKWWTVAEEGDNVQVEQAMQAALEIARSQSARLEFIHHPPKHKRASASVMDMFRGGGSIGAHLDVGALIEKVGDGNVRRLRYESRYSSTPTCEYVQLVGTRYEVTSDPKTAEIGKEREIVLAAVTTEPQTVNDIADALREDGVTITPDRARTRLNELKAEGKVEEGEKRGKKKTYLLRVA